jgi:2-aminoethylphosphonate-pyruvate transaminase
MRRAVAPTIVSMTPAVFHLPEPVNAVSRSYGAQPIVPRGPKFAPLLAEVRSRFRRALGAGAYEVVLMTGTGSTAMAAVLGSALRADERLAVVRNDAYGDRLAEFARRIGQPVVDVGGEWGVRPDLERLEDLCARGAVDAVAVVYGCTATCNLNPVQEIGAITRRHDKKLLVDGVSALFIEPMDLEGWGVSAVMGSCNKGLHAHPNLTAALVRRDLMHAMRDIPPRVPTLELYQTWQKQEQGAHPYTIDPMSVRQVEAALGFLEGLGGVAARHRIYAERCALLRAGYERLGLAIARWEGMPLASIGTALALPAGWRYEALAERLASDPVDDHVFEIYAAQGKLSSTLFRIFHMGEYPLAVYATFLCALEAAFEKGPP